MRFLGNVRLTREVAVRLAADAVMVAAALMTAMILRLLWLVVVEGVSSERELITSFLQAYLMSVWVLVLISLAVFSLSGFYTRGRVYQGRYKALVVTQAVSLSYLLFGFLSYLVRGDLLHLPRGALVLAWILSVGLLVVARVWAQLWANVVRAERHLNTRPEERQTRNVLVIGGAGYIGSALVPKLLDKGYRVRLFDLLLYGTEPIQHLLDHPRLTVVQADFRQVDKVVEAMQDIDAVIHMGAIVGDPACDLDEQLTIEVNLMATRMVAEVAKGSGVSRFVFASTCSVYGASDETLDERSDPNPVSLYARSKIASERVLRSMATDSFAPTFLRFGTIYGLSGRTRFDLVINLLTAKAIVDGQITIFGGDQWRPFLHVDDAALSVLKILEAPLSLVHNQAFNVGSDEQNYTIQQVGEIIHDLAPSAHLTNAGSGEDGRNYRVDFSKIRKTLGFLPQWTVEQGVQQVIEAIESGRVTDYRDAKYSNVKFLSEEGAFRLIPTQNGWANNLINETSSRATAMVSS